MHCSIDLIGRKSYGVHVQDDFQFCLTVGLPNAIVILDRDDLITHGWVPVSRHDGGRRDSVMEKKAYFARQINCGPTYSDGRPKAVQSSAGEEVSSLVTGKKKCVARMVDVIRRGLAVP